MTIFYAEHKYGFNWGPVNVVRISSDDEKGWVVLGIDTQKTHIELYFTRTGHIRLTEFYHQNWEYKIEE